MAKPKATAATPPNPLIEALDWVAAAESCKRTRVLAIRANGNGAFSMRRIEDAKTVSEIDFHGIRKFSTLKSGLQELAENE